MMEQRRWHSGTPQSQAFAERVQSVMELTSRLNTLPFGEVEARKDLLGAILGRPLPDTVTVYPPFSCDYGLGIEFGERVFVNQGCLFSDVGGISIGDGVLIGPRVSLITSGHPVDPAQRHDGITMAPINIEADVWIGASATICPGVTVGRGSIVGAGTVVAKDVPPMTVVTSPDFVVRKRLDVEEPPRAA